MEKKRRLPGLDGTALKLLAMLSMVFDHVGDNFFPEQTWMRIIGRIAMPIFAFFVAEGFLHTRDRRKYLLRMGVFALVSELPFDLLTAGRLEFGNQNVMCTFFLAIPVMAGASLLKLLKFGLGFTASELVILLVGCIMAFLVSIACIRFLMGYVKKHDFKIFGYYRIVLGIIVLLYFLIRH